jgi:hypothetical protein
MRSVPAIVFCLMFLVPAAHAQDLNPDDFNSVKAKRAIREYLDRGEKAAKKFLEEQDDATKDLVGELEKVLKQETADGNLDEAIRIRNTIDELKTAKGFQSAAGTNDDPGLSGFLGRWKIRFTTGDGDLYYDFVQKGNELRVIRWHEPDKRVQFDFPATFKDGYVVWSYNNGDRVERFHVHGDRLMIEHWHLAKQKTTDAFPQHFGIGEKVKQ